MLSAVHNDGRTETYTYGDSEWKDLLTALDGVALTYDGLGNPLSYYNGTSYTMSWIEGRKLSSVTVGAGTDTAATVTYQYNADGQRIRKNYSDGSYTLYLIADGRVLAERQYDSGGSVIIQLRYNYDENGTVCGYSTTVGGYPWTDYYFIRNLQGDVVQVFRDSDNAIVATYSYDSWGNILSATGDQAEVNPFRYRGYYYDEESGFYYLESRYYDPEVGRFINADSALPEVGTSILGYNMFAYCFNNPVNMIDSTGNWPEWVNTALKITAGVATIVTGVVIATTLFTTAPLSVVVTATVIGTVGGATINAATQYVENSLSWDNFDVDECITSGVTGGLSATLATTDIGKMGQGIGNAILSGTNSAINGNSFGDVVVDTLIGFSAGYVGGDGTGRGGFSMNEPLRNKNLMNTFLNGFGKSTTVSNARSIAKGVKKIIEWACELFD